MKTTKVHDTQTCEWFYKCENPTDIVYDHGILGPTRICERCANNLSIEIPKPTAGWNFVINYVEFGVKRFHRQFFMSPDVAVAESNVLTSFKIWHPKATEVNAVRMSAIPARQGWGDAPFWKTFERGDPATGDIIHGEQADELARSTE